MSFSYLSFASGSVAWGLIARFLDRRLLTYSAEGITVLETKDQLDGLSVTHNGKPVERLTRSHIRLWNAGRKAIRPSDVVGANPLRVSYPGAALLELKVLHATDDAVGFRPKADGDGWLIEFDYWEGRNGVVLEALHTSSYVVPKLTGSVDGLRPIKRLGRIDNGSFLSPRHRAVRRWLPIIALAVFTAGVLTVATFKLWTGLEPRMLLAFFAVAPGEMLLIAAVGVVVSDLWIPRPLRRIRLSAGENR
ncbi:hypothetical protein [Paraburkholderia fungorum]|uniref:hypothetical protein n=1 Tax=Paraburkholderia fungorum TaxID=134537 RepID=UPI003314432F